jgi:hypothetical protein
VIDGGWDQWVLADADQRSQRIITTPHNDGPLVIRSFPGLDPLASVPPPHDLRWDFTAVFVGDRVVARVLDDSTSAVVISPQGAVRPLAVGPGWLSPGPDQQWLTVERESLTAWRLAN